MARWEDRQSKMEVEKKKNSVCLHEQLNQVVAMTGKLLALQFLVVPLEAQEKIKLCLLPLLNLY